MCLSPAAGRVAVQMGSASDAAKRTEPAEAVIPCGSTFHRLHLSCFLNKLFAEPEVETPAVRIKSGDGSGFPERGR